MNIESRWLLILVLLLATSCAHLEDKKLHSNEGSSKEELIRMANKLNGIEVSINDNAYLKLELLKSLKDVERIIKNKEGSGTESSDFVEILHEFLAGLRIKETLDVKSDVENNSSSNEINEVIFNLTLIHDTYHYNCENSMVREDKMNDVSPIDSAMYAVTQTGVIAAILGISLGFLIGLAIKYLFSKVERLAQDSDRKVDEKISKQYESICNESVCRTYLINLQVLVSEGLDSFLEFTRLDNIRKAMEKSGEESVFTSVDRIEAMQIASQLLKSIQINLIAVKIVMALEKRHVRNLPKAEFIDFIVRKGWTYTNLVYFLACRLRLTSKFYEGNLPEDISDKEKVVDKIIKFQEAAHKATLEAKRERVDGWFDMEDNCIFAAYTVGQYQGNENIKDVTVSKLLKLFDHDDATATWVSQRSLEWEQYLGLPKGTLVK